jgi:hypothetical protein
MTHLVSPRFPCTHQARRRGRFHLGPHGKPQLLPVQRVLQAELRLQVGGRHLQQLIAALKKTNKKANQRTEKNKKI